MGVLTIMDYLGPVYLLAVPRPLLYYKCLWPLTPENVHMEVWAQQHLEREELGPQQLGGVHIKTFFFRIRPFLPRKEGKLSSKLWFSSTPLYRHAPSSFPFQSITLPALQKKFVNIFCRVCLGMLDWKMAGIFGEFCSGLHFPLNEAQKLLDKFGENSGNFRSAMPIVLKGTELRWQREPKTRIFAENRRFSQIHPFSWKFQHSEGAGNRRKPQIFAGNRRFSQETADWAPSP